jgi:MoaA/NifB/PqqE/SkfB family radical SAM enzyme
MPEHVEMHISDACNLNCRGCAHFAPTFENKLPDIESRLNDVRRLKGKVSHIIRFYILGGEPFLNPQIDDYVREIRKILPTTELYIVTNGLLINKLKSETLQTIRDNNVCKHYRVSGSA